MEDDRHSWADQFARRLTPLSLAVEPRALAGEQSEMRRHTESWMRAAGRALYPASLSAAILLKRSSGPLDGVVCEKSPICIQRFPTL